MNLYECKDCGCTFTEPDSKRETLEHAFGTASFDVRICPECASDEIEECAECGNRNCENPKQEMDNLCNECKLKLKQKLIKFFGELTDAELNQFDDWMDGVSIRSIESWK